MYQNALSNKIQKKIQAADSLNLDVDVSVTYVSL